MTATLRVIAVILFQFMGNAIINNASFYNAGIAKDFKPFTVYSDDDLVIGDLVSRDHLSYSYTISTQNAFNFILGNSVLVGISSSRTETIFTSWTDAVSTHFNNIYSISILGTDAAYKNKASIKLSCKLDESHFVTYSCYRDGEDYVAGYITIFEVNRSNGQVTLKSQYKAYDVSSIDPYNGMAPFNGGFVIQEYRNHVINGTLQTEYYINTFYVNNDYDITYGKKYTIDGDYIGDDTNIVIINPPGTNRIYNMGKRWPTMNISGFKRLTIPSSTSGNVIDDRLSYGDNIDLHDAFFYNNRLYISGALDSDNDEAIISIVPVNLTTGSLIKSDRIVIQNSVFNIQSPIWTVPSRLIDDAFLFLYTRASGTAVLFASLLDSADNMFLGDFVRSPAYGSSPHFEEFFKDRYSIWKDGTSVRITDMRHVTKYDISHGLAGKISAVLGSGKYEMIPLG